MRDYLIIEKFYMFNNGGHCMLHRKDLSDKTCWALSTLEGEPLLQGKESAVFAGHYTDDFEYLNEFMEFDTVEQATDYFNMTNPVDLNEIEEIETTVKELLITDPCMGNVILNVILDQNTIVYIYKLAGFEILWCLKQPATLATLRTWWDDKF